MKFVVSTPSVYVLVVCLYTEGDTYLVLDCTFVCGLPFVGLKHPTVEYPFVKLE